MGQVIPGESWHFERTDADGTVHVFRLVGDWDLETVDGADVPAMTHAARELIGGDGQELLSSRVDERQVIFGIAKSDQVSADDRAEDIELLKSMLRPNPTPVRIVRTLASGERRVLSVVVENVESDEAEGAGLTILETVSFVAYDPFWRSAVEKVITLPLTTAVAQASAAFTSAVSGRVVTFSNGSSPISPDVSFFWNFGDGNWSRERSPIHRYAVAGSYVVRLTAHLPSGAANVSSATVVVA